MESKPNYIGGLKTVINNLDVDSEKSDLPIQMIGDRVLILPQKPEKYLSEVVKIERPVDYKDPYSKGIVKSIGGGEYGYNLPNHLKTGLTVAYFHQQGMEIEISGDVYHCVRASDILAYL